MEYIYHIFSPFINIYYSFFDYNEEIYIARKYKRLVLRGDKITEDQFNLWFKYRFHPAVVNHKW